MNPITALLQLLSGCTDCEEIKSLCSLFPHGAHHGQGLHLDLADDVSGELTLSLTLLVMTVILYLQALTAECRSAPAGKSCRPQGMPFLLRAFLTMNTSLRPMQFPTIHRLSTPFSTATKASAAAKVNVLPLAAALMPTELKMLSHLAVPLVTLTITCTGQMSLRKSQHSS